MNLFFHPDKLTVSPLKEHGECISNLEKQKLYILKKKKRGKVHVRRNLYLRP